MVLKSSRLQGVWRAAEVSCSVLPKEEETEGRPHCAPQLSCEGKRRDRHWFLLCGDQWVTGPEIGSPRMWSQHQTWQSWRIVCTILSGQWCDFGGWFCAAQDLGLVVLVGPFQLSISCNSVLLTHWTLCFVETDKDCNYHFNQQTSKLQPNPIVLPMGDGYIHHFIVSFSFSFHSLSFLRFVKWFFPTF